MPYAINGMWINWTSYLNNPTLNTNISNTTDPISAFTNSVAVALPWFWPVIALAFYIMLWILYADSPGRFKLVGISALCLILSIIMAATGLINDAVINVILFGLALFFSYLFKA